MDDYDYIFYNKFFYNNLCHVCKSRYNIKRCSSCKTLAYCSKYHQQQDWNLHKKLCKIITETNRSRLQHGIQQFRDFRDLKVGQSVLWTSKLGRELDSFEKQIWMFPRVCSICFSKDVLIDCPNCLNVSYCSEKHRNQFKQRHLEYCDEQKLCMEIDVYYFNRKFRPTDINVKPFDEAIKILPKNLRELMFLYTDSVPENTLEEKIQFIIKSNFIGPIATILYGLEKSGLLDNRILAKGTLTIHIVGADITEMGWLWKIITELPFHWIRNIDTLNFFVIGPEIFHDGVTEKFAEQLCDHCKIKKPKTTITFCCKLYHKVVDSITKPDIVVAFNSGLHEFYDDPKNYTWKESIKSLTKYCDVPLVLTAYTMHEIVQDVSLVLESSSYQVKTILEPQRNPFSNLRPFRDWESQDIPVFYLNGYIAILSAIN